jgi:hypothetical protein
MVGNIPDRRCCSRKVDRVCLRRSVENLSGLCGSSSGIARSMPEYVLTPGRARGIASGLQVPEPVLPTSFGPVDRPPWNMQRPLASPMRRDRRPTRTTRLPSKGHSPEPLPAPVCARGVTSGTPFYCAFIQLSDPVSLTDTSERVIRNGLPSAVPRCSVEIRRGPAFLYPAQVAIKILGLFCVPSPLPW